MHVSVHAVTTAVTSSGIAGRCVALGHAYQSTLSEHVSQGCLPLICIADAVLLIPISLM